MRWRTAGHAHGAIAVGEQVATGSDFPKGARLDQHQVDAETVAGRRLKLREGFDLMDERVAKLCEQRSPCGQVIRGDEEVDIERCPGIGRVRSRRGHR